MQTRYSEGSSVFAPDGRWLAYQSNETGRFEIYLRSFPDGERTLQVSTEGGIEPQWSPRGDMLFFRATNGRMMGVSAGAFDDAAHQHRAGGDTYPIGRELRVGVTPARSVMWREKTIFP